MRLLLSITDNWQPTGGADQFVRWAGLASHEAFYSDPSAKQYYKDHVRTLLTRCGREERRRGPTGMGRGPGRAEEEGRCARFQYMCSSQ